MLCSKGWMNMEKIITVQGTGCARVRPDQIECTCTLTAPNPDYAKAMATADAWMDELRIALAAVGHDPDALRTSSFRVRSEYENRRDKNGEYQRVFVGYACVYELHLTFALDLNRLADTVDAVARCAAHPELGIAFTVRSTDAARQTALADAAQHARRTAEALCAAAGAELGALLRIDACAEPLDNASPTRFEFSQDLMRTPAKMRACADVSPEDVALTESAAFTWAIE